jgi:O-antigen/teichoic acid export membrane protein
LQIKIRAAKALINLLKTVYAKVGLDRSIVFTILARFVQAIGGIITLLLVTSLLDRNEQGYYYTFTSILAIQVFFELGLTSIIVQYIAHEAAHLSWNNLEIVGEEYHKSRLASIVRQSIIWVLLLTLVLIIVFFVAGRVYFSEYNAELGIHWQLPWLVLSIGSCLLQSTNLVLCIIEGLGKVKETARLRLILQILYSGLIAVFFLAGFKLLSAGITLVVSFVVTIFLLVYYRYWDMIVAIWRTPVTHKVSYRKEVFSYHYKIGLGAISSYLIYTLFSPILFATQGAVIAGQMGATQTFLTGILSVALSWYSTKTVLFSNLVATKKFNELNSIYKSTLFIACMVCLAGVVAFALMVVFLGEYYPRYGNRFLPVGPVILFGITQVANVIGNGQAYYLRSFKEEPFFIPSVLTGLFTGAATVLISRYFSINEMSIAYFLINVGFGFLWGCIIFRRKSYQWTGYKHFF